MNLSRIERPSRYIDHEVNAIAPKPSAEVRVALAFPDIYDVGMSHLGLKILYHIINALPWASAERAFHPWTDMEAAMRANGEPLCSLEGGTPLARFDVLGFSLQYELCYTSVLNMLELSGIPLRAEARGDGHPLVIGGGPCTVNPLPVAPFFDALLIGDGEEAVPEMLEAIRRAKAEGRTAVLKALSAIEGVYVPSVHGLKPSESVRIRRRFIKSLDDSPYPTAPVVPYAEVIHDRIAIEVSRGCSMGCRYCQAGMIYRPVRERSPEKILRLATEALKNTGYDEIAFVSLSAGDYSCLYELIRGFNRKLSEKRVAVSLPSLRVAAVSEDVLAEIRSVRKTGFTIAPEAATARLRSVINKDFSDEDYERTVDILFREGWQNLKLYYMIGLPTEAPEDIEAIPSMVHKAIRIAKRYSKRFTNLSVSVSPFVPKAHTPFQWYGQRPIEYMEETRRHLMREMRKINYRGHDPETSALEAAFARGGVETAALIEAAHKNGARLDGWTECFKLDQWKAAMESTGIDAYALAQKEYPLEEPLPWDFIDTGVSKAYMKREYARALDAAQTSDCSKSCTGCGLKCRSEGLAAEHPSPDAIAAVSKPAAMQRPARNPIKVRARYTKTGPLRYLSHRELITHITRALQRANVALEYSHGFHPAPKISFGPPLSVGVAGTSEYLDMEILPLEPLEDLRRRINSCLGEGMEMTALAAVEMRAQSLQAFIGRYVCEVRLAGADAASIEKGLDSFLGRSEYISERDKGPVNIRPMVEEASALGDGRYRMVLIDQPDKKVRVEEITQALFGRGIAELDITRTGVFGRVKDGGWITPLEA